ncbi:hypothetical protein KBC79_00170 [Candidatus Woesebacteria bacterium]|nr:hypothetical protein [Candidatus Woesebacteria bacterium]
MLEKTPQLRDVSHVRDSMPIAGRILERIELLNYRFQLKHPDGSFFDALKSPELTPEMVELVVLFFAAAVPEATVAQIKYIWNGVAKNEW